MTLSSLLRALGGAVLAGAAVLSGAPAHAATYANASFPFNWIDASTHTKIGYNTSPYKFQSTTGGCGTAPPILDDTISDQIPIGFSFMFAGVNFTQVRVMTNGRLQFNNNVTCGFGSPVTQLPYPNSGLNYTMRIYGNDLDPSLKGENTGNSTYTNTPCVNRAVCYVSYATIGTAPYRSFVVTWANVPEWVQGKSPVGGYNMQLILQENGEFIYQYGTDVPGPNANNGDVGWQAGDTTDYDNPPNGFPVNNTAIKFYIGQPVAEYRMEQPTKPNGIAFDTSGNGYNGNMLGGVLTDSIGKVCRDALIPANSSTATIDAIDTTIPLQKIGGVGMIDFWYKSNTAWTGSKDVQLLDATVASGVYFFLVKRANGDLRFVITDTKGTVQAVETTAISVAAGTWKHIAVTWNFNALAASNSDHMRIYVDGALSKEQAFTTTGFPAATGTLYIGDNRSSIIGSLGTGNSADGAIDEVRIYNYEGSAVIARDMNASALGCATHYAVTDVGTGSTCQPSNVTVIAHDSNHGLFVMPNNTTTIQLSTSTGRGTWTLVTGYGTLTPSGNDDGKATYLFNGEYQAVFALRHTVPGTVTVHVTDGQLTESENQNLSIVACASGSFNACVMPTPSVPAVVRCTPTANPPAGQAKNNSYANLPTRLAKTGFALDIVKLQTDGTLDTSFNSKTATVELLANTKQVDGATIDPNTLCPTVTPTEVVPLGTVNFVNGRLGLGAVVSATAFTAVSPNYSVFRDVRVRVTCDAANCGTAVTSCSTDAFAVRPAVFVVSADMTDTPSNHIVRHAGLPFTLTVASVAETVNNSASTGYDGTPQIANNTAATVGGTPPSVYVSQTNPIGNTPGTGKTPFSDALANVDPNAGLTNNLVPALTGTGVSTTGTMRFDDIGYLGMGVGTVRDQTFTSIDQQGDCVAGSTSNMQDSNGLIGCNIANAATVDLIGRFSVDHFDLSYSLSNACTGFSYMDQREMGIGVLLRAMSHSNKVLSRYATGSVAVTGENTSASGTLTTFNPLGNRLSPDFSSLAWANGMAGRSYTTDAVTHLAGSTSIKLAGVGTIVSGDIVRFSGDATKYAVSTGTTSAGSPIVIAPGLASDLAGSTPMYVLHKFTRGATPDGPYDNFALRAAVSDPDGALITVINGGSPPGASSQPMGNASDGGALRLRYGRLRIDNAYGSEKLDLPVRVTAQFYNGSTAGYVPSSLDSSCTVLTPASFSMDNYVPASTSANMPASNLTVTTPMQLGFGAITLTKPLQTPAITRKFNVRVNSTIPYLPGQGTETFGLFRAGQVIYQQEVH